VGAPAGTGLGGTTPAGVPLELKLGEQRTVLFFLTSSCHGCRVLWHGLGEKRGAGVRVVLVTPSPSTESARDVAALAPAGMEVLMSSDAWHAFGVTAAPWFVVVEAGVITAEGAAPGATAEIAALVAAGPNGG
jgi:hypothetical protein